MKHSLEEKIRLLMKDLWEIGDDVAETVASKLTWEEILAVVKAHEKSKALHQLWYCQKIMELPRQRDRVAQIEKDAQEHSEISL